MSERVEWNGGECPVHPDTRVRVWFRGEPACPVAGGRAKSTWWNHNGRASDIIAYEVLKDQTPGGSEE